MLRFSLLILTLASIRTNSFKSSEFGSNNFVIRINNTIVNSTLTNNGHMKKFELALFIDNVEYILDLVINSYLFYANYTEKLISVSGFTIIESNTAAEHCYYVGKVRNYSNSLAAISTCSHIQGFFSFGNFSYRISQPIQQSRSSFQSKYHIKRIYNESLRMFCDNNILKRNVRNAFTSRNKRSTNDPYNDLLTIKLYIVNDFDRYKSYNLEASKLFENTKAIVNMASAIYQYVGIYVVLVGAEIFTDKNPISISTDKESTLSNFNVYRQTSITQYNDNAFLITGVCFDGSIIGSAYLNSMCAFKKSCGILCEDQKDADHVGKTLAHEIGHNLGLNHDGQACSCPDARGCVMNAYNVDSMKFSSCSMTSLKTNLPEYKMCLALKPETTFQKISYCGNGLIDDQENCDCGNLSPDLCNQACCNSTVCQLIIPARCAQGLCCNIQTCQMYDSNHVCRASTDPSCDIQEVCSGRSPECPPDRYLLDATQCNTRYGAGYCVKGICGNRDAQCKFLWGEQSVVAPLKCFQIANILGSASGYCKNLWSYNEKFEKCEISDVECGLLHCNNNGGYKLLNFHAFFFISYITIDLTSYYGVTFDFGTRVTSPGLVPDGAPCGNYSQQMCYQQKCVDKSIFKKCENCIQGWFCTNSGCQCDINLTDCSSPPPSTSPNVGLIVGLVFLFLILITTGVVAFFLRRKIMVTVEKFFGKIKRNSASHRIPTVSDGRIDSISDPSVDRYSRPAPLPPPKPPKEQSSKSQLTYPTHVVIDTFTGKYEYPQEKPKANNRRPPTIPPNKPKFAYSNRNVSEQIESQPRGNILNRNVYKPPVPHKKPNLYAINK